MAACGASRATRLHLTSWDRDHCCPEELEALLELSTPDLVECPGYPPESDSALESMRIIHAYREARQPDSRITVRAITPAYIGTLQPTSELSFRNIYYHPRYLDPECSNNNSTVALFRRGIFNVLSLGDLESPFLSRRLAAQRTLGRETDVLILAHHGADNGFTTRELIRALKPKIAVCSSDRDNQHDHPRQEIRNLLGEEGVELATTKDGDVVIASLPDSSGNHSGSCVLKDLRGEDLIKSRQFRSKKATLLGYNADTLRQLYAPKPHHRRR